jgi:hypothetical protein
MLVTQPTHMTVAEYCAAMHRQEIVVNKNYQRSDQVWPDIARSFLIESILLGFPIPKIYHHSITDLKSRRTVKEIVDGQQRSRAIYDFFYDRFRLSRKLETEEVRGLVYSELPEEWQSRFISYLISIDQILAAAEDEVVQIFRRMNSYTVPLNPEELRNAQYQGPFKWFIYGQSRKYEVGLSELGVFGEKAFVRMQDMKLLTEISYAIENGITTTNKRALDSIYKKYDREFPKEAEFSDYLKLAFDQICDMRYLADSNLNRPHMIYSLALALIVFQHPIPGYEARAIELQFDSESLERRLLSISAALALDDEAAKGSPFGEFIAASSEKTNVKAQRETRIAWFVHALDGAGA